jgi:Flp pilus assembly protein TadG
MSKTRERLLRGRPAAGTRRGDAGQVAVEFLGAIPYLILGVLAALQLTFAVSAVQATSTAARAAARTASQGDGNPYSSARRAVPGWVDSRMTVSIGGGASGQVTVRTRIPIIFPGLADGPQVTRRAWFDPEQGPSPWG